MKAYDVYKLEKSNKFVFVGVFEASMPFDAMDKAQRELSIPNCTMKALPTGSERAEKFALENK